MADDKHFSHRKRIGIGLAVALVAGVSGFVLAAKFHGAHHASDSIAGFLAAIGGSIAAVAAALRARQRSNGRTDG